LTAQDVMMTDCPRLPRDLPLNQLVHDYVLHSEQRCFPVVENNCVLGVITFNEIKTMSQARWDTVTVGEVMVPFEQTFKVLPTVDLSQVVEQMDKQQVSQLPVVETNHLLGMVSRKGIEHTLKTRLELNV